MLGSYNIHTDLALEDKERFESDNVEISGVSVEEFYDEEHEIRVTEVKILTENGAKSMRKPIGTYITMEMANLVLPDEEYHHVVAEELSKYVKLSLLFNILNSFLISSILVPLGFPEIFALGAAIGSPVPFIISFEISFLGILTATVSSPPVTQRGTLSDLGKIIVRGPGQNFSARTFACSGTSRQYFSIAPASGTIKDKGLIAGLPLTS